MENTKEELLTELIEEINKLYKIDPNLNFLKAFKAYKELKISEKTLNLRLENIRNILEKLKQNNVSKDEIMYRIKEMRFKIEVNEHDRESLNSFMSHGFGYLSLLIVVIFASIESQIEKEQMSMILFTLGMITLIILDVYYLWLLNNYRARRSKVFDYIEYLISRY